MLKGRSPKSAGGAGICDPGASAPDVPTVALVGYTNAGKTTLFNLLTGATRSRRTRCS